MKLMINPDRTSFLKEVEDKRKRIGLFKSIEKYVKENYDLELYWDYNQELSIEQIAKLIESEDGYFEIYDELFERNLDYIIELEDKAIEEVKEHFKKDLEALGFNPDDIDEAIREHCYVKTNIDSLIKNTGPVPIRVTLFSNYDGFDSTYPYWDMTDHFKQIVDVLCLNPKSIKQEFVRVGITPKGSWPDLKYRNGKELVKYDQFIEELINPTTHYNFLTFIGQLSVYGIKNKITRIRIPAGNSCGLFDSCNGAGSLMEMELLRDFEIDLTKKGKSEYDYFRLEIDEANKYGIKETYGVSNSFFDGEIDILKQETT